MTLTGLANAHTHVYSGLVPFGMPRVSPPPRDFPEILARVWWRLDRALDEASLRASTRLYAAEALLAGTTALIDHHESPSCIEGSLDVIADACQELGMRAVLCYGATERNGGTGEARRGLGECRRFILANRRSLVRGVVGLHASFTVSDETLDAAGRLCHDLGTVLHVHLAEDRVDVDDARRRGYEGPLERLLARDALPPGSILAHGVHLSDAQVRRAEDAGCWLVQNPRSNRANRVGYPAALRVSSRVALGTDGFAADMMAELRALLETGTAAGDPPATLDDRCAACLRLAGERLGVAVESPPPGVATSEWLVSRRDAARRQLDVDGRRVIDGGFLVTADVERIRAEAREQAERLWSRLPPDADVTA